MAGTSNDCNPDQPGIWLCHQIPRNLTTPPDWMLPSEADKLTPMEGTRQREFLTSRWLMRQALSHASGTPPTDCQPAPGRPVASTVPEGWHLSLSHSHGLTACAVGRSPVGIDIEPSQRRPDWMRVVKRWFSAVEQEWLLANDDPFSFLKAWTLKEAWLKATGRGIAGNLQTLEVRKQLELYGDQPDRHWQACGFYVDGFLVTIVYPHSGRSGDPETWPGISLLEPPPEDYRLTRAERQPTNWEPLFHRVIRAKP